MSATASGSNGNKLRLVVGANTWLLHASKPISYSFTTGVLRIWELGSSGSTFTGVFRVSWLPSGATAAAAEAMLDAHVDAVPIGGGSAAWYSSENAISAVNGQAVGQYELTWSKASLTGTAAPGPLLMLAMPHHLDSLRSPSNPADPAVFPLGVSSPGYIMSVRGPLVPVVGDKWQLREELPPLLKEVSASRITNAGMRASVEAALLVSGAGGHGSRQLTLNSKS
jgi:hypothetical protein